VVSVAVWASAIVAFANIGLVVALLYAYFQNYRALRSYFTQGLVLFAFLFLGVNLAIVGLWLFLFTNIAVAELFVDQAMSWMLLINVAQLVGLVSLVRITFK
jgi:hypothetical protein